MTLADIEKVLDIEVETSITVHNWTITANLPIRRYGDLRRIAKDRRLDSLVKYYTRNSVISYDEIEKEFERYDERREQFFEEIYNFEKEVANKFPSDFLVSKDYFDHKYFLNVATRSLADDVLKTHYKNNVVNLRNKFLHNQIPDFTPGSKPDFTWLASEIDFTKTDFVNQIFDIAEKYYKDLLAMI